MSKNTSTWQGTLGSGLLTVVMLLAAGLVAALVVVPKALGGASLTVLSGSMEPGIMPGDVVVTRGVDDSSMSALKVGDVITFLPYPDDPTLVTHRIVGLAVSAQGTSYVTQGDNNNAVDPWGPVQANQIRGQLMYRVPKVGWVREWVGDSSRWVIVCLAAALIGFGGWSVVASFRQPKSDPDNPPARRVLASEGPA